MHELGSKLNVEQLLHVHHRQSAKARSTRSVRCTLCQCHLPKFC